MARSFAGFHAVALAALAVVGAFAGALAAPAAAAENDADMGVNIHAFWEHELVPREFAMAKDAGLGWVRVDFSWRDQEREGEGKWNWTRHDLAVAEAEKAGLKLLPILGYAPPWGDPALEHMDKWLDSVERNIDRYGDRLTHWEIWNEHNYDVFWKNPDPLKYLELLKATAARIRAKKPDAVIVFGGTSQIPLSYLEAMFKNGAADHFDVMNVHPYNWYDIPELELEKQIADLKALMAQYNIDKPVWVTEIGWPTGGGTGYLRQFIAGALKTAGVDWTRAPVAVVEDARSPLTLDSPGTDLRALLPGAKEIRSITLDDIAALDPAECPALFPSPNEVFSVEPAHADALVEYVRKGGLAVFPRGVPLYHGLRRDVATGLWSRSWIDKDAKTRLRVAFDAWWLDKDKPVSRFFNGEVPEGMKDAFPIAKPPGANLVFTDAALKDGDRLIPLVEGVGDDGRRGPVAAYYKFDSDFKGGVIASAAGWIGMANATEDQQARLLPRTLLTLYKAGVDKVFWFEFQAMENNPNDGEHYFGVVHKDLAPKPAYTAWAALGRARPIGSTKPAVVVDAVTGLRVATWTRSDGDTAHAVWTTAAERPARLAVEGAAKAAWTYLGEDLAWPAADAAGTVELPVGSAPVYVIGPRSIQPAR